MLLKQLLQLLLLKKAAKLNWCFIQKVSIGTGKDANNPWLQELPDPITKATWDNYAIISYAMAKELGIALDDNYEVEVTKAGDQTQSWRKRNVNCRYWLFPACIQMPLPLQLVTDAVKKLAVQLPMWVRMLIPLVSFQRKHI